MSSAALESDLRRLGVACAVEARDRLAVLMPMVDTSCLADAGVRREVVRLAQVHGFTHIALELDASARGETPDASTRRGA